MKTNQYLGQLGGALFEKKAWMLAFFVSLMINLGLTAGLLLKNNSVITTFIPPELNQPFTLNDGNYSNAYVEQVSTWFLAQTLNYTPSSYKYQLSTFLKHVDADLFSELRQKLLKEFEDITKQRRSSTFFTQKVRIKGLTALVSGIRKITVGSTEASTEKEHWYIKLSKRRDGLVTLSDIKKVPESDVPQFLASR